MTAERDDTPEVLPLLEETVAVAKRRVETGRVRISTRVTERQEWIEQTLEREDVTVERVPVDEVVAEPPAVRQEGDTLIIPVLEEVVVVEKLLVLKEELHVRKHRRREQVREPVSLRTEQAVVERMPSAAADPSPEPDEGDRHAE